MKRNLLLSLSFFALTATQAQKQKPTTAYAITGVEKGGSSWTEVRLVDITTGEELQSIYASNTDAEVLNARTGKPVAKKDDAAKRISVDKPFATTSAACAYDKKNNRLYYTPMGIAQLRYIDLKAKSPKVYYFEDEAFGVVKSKHDVANQITRMVIGGDGNGYALSNDGNHLMQFTLKKKPVITDLGALTDDATNGRHSIHAHSAFGGDMIADKDGNLYLIAANRSVFKINLASKVASYTGSIQGLPRGFSTNGAIATGDSKVIVSSSGSTTGYYSFDLNTLQAEKISNGGTVFNASDLANASFAFEKKEKEEKPAEQPVTVAAKTAPMTVNEVVVKNAISVYPNPVTDGYFNLSFADQKPGRYQVQLLDVSGKVVSVQQVNINNKVQVEEFRLPQKVAAGSYVVRVTNEDGSYVNTNKVVVQ